MKYKGIELKEFTSDKPILFDPPRMMLVWGEDWCGEEEVVAYIPGRDLPVITMDGSDQCCAEIPEQPKPRLATLGELAKWLAIGEGQAQTCGLVYSDIVYDVDRACDDADNYFVRKWDDKEWHEPTVDYMGLED